MRGSEKKEKGFTYLNTNKMEQLQQFQAGSDTKYVFLC